MVCATTPPGFEAVGQVYDDFHQVGDDEVRGLLATPTGGASITTLTGGEETYSAGSSPRALGRDPGLLGLRGFPGRRRFALGGTSSG